MLARRFTIAAAALTVAALMTPISAQAEPWTFFDWARPVHAGEWGQPIYPAATQTITVAPRRQRVAAVVVPEPVRKPAPRMLLVGIGF